jgi:hypothetical protein
MGKLTLKDIIKNDPTELHYKQEAIYHQLDNTLGKEIEAEFERLAKNRLKLNQTKIEEIIKKHTNIKVTLDYVEGLTAYVHIPDINHNNVILNAPRKAYFSNKDSDKLLKDKNIMRGSVDLVKGKVHGCYEEIVSQIVIGTALFEVTSKFTAAEVTAILLHELGHLFVYFEMLATIFVNNFVVAEAAAKLNKAESKQQKALLIKEFDEVSGTSLSKNEQLEVEKLTEEGYAVVLLTEKITESKNMMNIDIYSCRSFEQLADGFAARMGYYEALATGLDKMHRMSGSNAYYHPWLNLFINIIYALLLNSWFLFIVVIMLLFVDTAYSEYDSPKERIDKIKRQLISATKLPNLTHEYRAHLIKQYDTVNGLLDEMYENYNLFELIDWVKSMSKRKIIRQQIEMERLLNNDLFMSKTKLDAAGTGIPYVSTTLPQNVKEVGPDVVLGIFKHGNKFLTLVYQRSSSVIFPGGKIDKGESPETAIVRELNEELGITVTATAPLGFFYSRVDEKVPADFRKIHLFEITDYIGTVTNKEPHKHAAMAFRTKEEIIISSANKLIDAGTRLITTKFI